VVSGPLPPQRSSCQSRLHRGEPGGGRDLGYDRDAIPSYAASRQPRQCLDGCGSPVSASGSLDSEERSVGERLQRGPTLDETIEQAVDAGEADEVLRADAIATGVIDGVASHVVVEVSITCDTDDIDRAARRAGILQQAGLVAVPLVACEACSRDSLAYARSRQVRVWCNGVILDAAA